MQRLKFNSIIKALITFIILATSQRILAQDLKEISKQDTIYFYFKHKKNEKFRGLRLFTTPNIRNMEYFINLKRINQIFFLTYYEKIKNYTGEIYDNPPIVKPKNFLKTNKAKILTTCKLQKFSLHEIKDFYWKNFRKVIYVIDRKDIKGKEIYLKKVTWGSSFPIEQ